MTIRDLFIATFASYPLIGFAGPTVGSTAWFAVLCHGPCCCVGGHVGIAIAISNDESVFCVHGSVDVMADCGCVYVYVCVYVWRRQ